MHIAGGTIIGSFIVPENFPPDPVFAGLPPVISFAPPALRDRIVADALSAKRPICLAVTEAFAGSDVQGLRCRATPVEGGWVVNGTKKWITNGMWAHYFVVAARRTDNREMIILVVERVEGVQTKPIKTSYSSSAAGTSFITFDQVFVPSGNQLGAGHPAVNIILQNFNHERCVQLFMPTPLFVQGALRWVLAAHSIAGQRMIFEECFKLVNPVPCANISAHTC
jgi:alkylation response protein AidB-like acyl-CoA dehydrogenase